jgi:predicted O-linked N-acetylglucosamine transferase (SPINDLY family)
VAASLLNATHLSELITSTQKEYEMLAIELGLNPKKLADIKLKMLDNLLSAPLFNTPRFTKSLEAAYLDMHRKHQSGLHASHIY